MRTKTRISKKPIEFNNYMNLTDDLQVSITPPASTKRYLLWGWTDDESSQWTAFRHDCNQLFAEYSDPDKSGHGVIAKMNETVSKVRYYDNSKKDGHHLLDKVALNGTVDDCLTFNVVRGTVLQADPVHHSDGPVTLLPTLVFKKHELGSQIIGVSCSTDPKSKKLPEGIVFAKIYRYVGKTPPTSLMQYQFIGNAKYGEFTSQLADIIIPEGETWEAHYFGRYESCKGTLGNPSAVISAPIMQAK
jgi:hypothetical protein